MRSVCLLLILSACSSDGSAQATGQLVSAFPGLTFRDPVDIQAPPDGSGRLFVVEQVGTIRVFTEDASTAASTVFLDLQGRLVSGGERGLLGLAFHPRFPDSAYVYVNYTAPNPLRTVVARFTVSAATPDDADEGSEHILLEVPQPFSNHNAGQLQFGPDGYLYVGLGDGGSGGDPQNHGQRPTTLLGSMLRLDVDGGGLPPDCGGPNARYTIPPTNPFAGQASACDEVFAYGLRNPWRFSFGPDGTLYAADVGQGAWEEVDTLTAGGNYGWNRLEGSRCYNAASCSAAGTILPVAEYPHNRATGGFSITGGYVYTGAEAACSSLRGQYLYGDFVSGNIWALSLSSGTPVVRHLVQNAAIGLSTFGVGQTGTLYLADHGGGKLYRLDCATLTAQAAPPEAPGGFRLGAPFPNPTTDQAHFYLQAAVPQPVEVIVLDALGRLVQRLRSGVVSGTTPLLLQVDTSSLPGGLYAVRATSASGSQLRWFVVAR